MISLWTYIHIYYRMELPCLLLGNCFRENFIGREEEGFFFDIPNHLTWYIGIQLNRYSVSITLIIEITCMLTSWRIFYSSPEDPLSFLSTFSNICYKEFEFLNYIHLWYFDISFLSKCKYQWPTYRIEILDRH